MAEVVLDEWAVAYANEGPFGAPELAGIMLVGKVTGHPKKPDGSRIRTSEVLRVECRLVLTASGTIYRLGEPSAEYRVWLAEHRPDWDPENPIVARHAAS